jgi:hypothetical protein
VQWCGRLTALVVGLGIIIIATLMVFEDDFELWAGFFLGPIFIVYAVGGNAAFLKNYGGYLNWESVGHGRVPITRTASRPLRDLGGLYGTRA